MDGAADQQLQKVERKSSYDVVLTLRPSLLFQMLLWTWSSMSSLRSKSSRRDFADTFTGERSIERTPGQVCCVRSMRVILHIVIDKASVLAK